MINYCSNEKRFINRVIDECKAFSDDIIVVRADCFLDGTPDDDRDLSFCGDGFKVIDVEYNKQLILPSRWWHNHFRNVGWENVKNDYVMFLDADEIPNGKDVMEFLELVKFSRFNAISFDAHWYFRGAENQATVTEETVAMFRTSYLNQEMFYNDHERWGMFISGPMTRRMVSPITYSPMFHHMSWVRTRDEMLRKVSVWGHNADNKDWTQLVKDEFEHEFNGTDFVHGYEYRKVAPIL